MHIMETRFPCSPPFATVIIIVILFALNFSVLSAGASAPWIEVHPPDIEERNSRIQFIRFIDADTGWAEAYGVLLRTSDGGLSWREDEPLDDTLGLGIHFISLGE